MDWQGIRTRAAAFATKLKQRLPPRRVVLRAAALGFAVGMLAIAIEAVVRGRLDSPTGRIATTLYTRPSPWPAGNGRNVAVPIGTLDGSPLDERVPVQLSDLPDPLIQAVLAVEDQRFFQHHGLDLRRIAGALVANVRAGGIAQGGSTLTQQLAKNLYLSAGRTPLRKLREAALAVVLELRYGKRQILEAYLNEIYLGQDGPRAIHGVGAAARFYFGKDVRRVTLAEAAQLAAMISAPNRTVASRHPEYARQRRDMVLQLMGDQHRVPEARVQRAIESEISTGEHPSPMLESRYFRDFAVANLSGKVPPRGGSVVTTLDAAMQRAAERAVQRTTGRMQAAGVEAALVAIDPRRGDVLAMVGGRDYSLSQFNRAIAARRQPGSAFKPIVALAALERENGHGPAFTLASVLQDEPLRVTSGKTVWEPVNYDQEFRGPVTLRQALEESLNVPFARIGLAVGPERIVSTAHRLGITSPLRAVPSLALGSSEVSLLELVRAYGVLADDGKLATSRTVLSGAPDTGTVSVAVADPAAAFLVTSALQGVVTRGTGRALNDDQHLGPIAGKTGTTSDWRDAWFIAYSPTLVVGVWVGYDDGRSLRMTGASAALPIVASFLDDVTPDGGWDPFPVPEGVSEADIDVGDGAGPSECGAREFFLSGTEPRESACAPFVRGRWDETRNWGAALARRAQRLIEGLLSRRSRWGAQERDH